MAPTDTSVPTDTPVSTDTPVPTDTPTLTPPPKDPLTLLVPTDFAERFQRQAEQFTAATSIAVDVVVIPVADYLDMLQVMLAAGEPIDAYLAGAYNLPIPETAVRLDDYMVEEGVDIAAFLPGAVDTFTVDGALLALPVEVPAACEPLYRALAISPTAMQPDVAAKLISFLAADAQQIEAFHAADGQILPTLTALYDELAIECPVARRPVPPLPGQSEEAIQVVDANKESLRLPLDQYAETLQKYDIPFETVDLVSTRAVAAERPIETVESGAAHKAVGLAAMQPQTAEKGVMVAALAPINVNVTDEQANLLMSTTPGLILGGAFGVLPSKPPFFVNEHVLEPGEYVLVAARATADDGGSGAVDIYVIDGQGGEIYAGTQPRFSVQNQVPEPLVIITEGSCWIQWSIDKMMIQAIC